MWGRSGASARFGEMCEGEDTAEVETHLRMGPLLHSFLLLAVSGTLKVLPEVQLDVEWGGSIVIECPLPQTPVRMYLCRQMTDPGICTTVVSNTFVNKEYKERVTLKPCLDRKLFLVEMTWLTENDNGIYACGVGINTDRGKTQKVILNVHNGKCLEN